ncbi:two-partner secretion system transporter CdrB [Paralimibaculum aggregatum]|uniref:Two-partner secretion system transporter CdrB n=2 Tax=Paralimibaculum aggregatum TaxID=3036245 RepID=A0ABQ6LJX0_9RHOB|nr:two-partner secretion system transporter CdrB [Limibaculum sp. NKW23]
MSGEAAAQAQPARPPGQVYTRETVEPQIPQRPGALAAEEAPALVAPLPPSPGAPQAGGVSFVLNGVDFAGSSVYAPEALQALVADRIGEPVDFGGLKEITDAVEALYRGDGYLAVRAVIPAQRIAGGRVRVQIVEAAIAEVVIRGDLGRAEPQVRRSLERVVGLKPVRSTDVERALLLARDLPGVNLLGALRARQSEVPGELVLLVEGQLAALDGFVSLSNFAADTAGPLVATGGAAVNSALLSGDRFEVVGLTALDIGEELLGQISYAAPTGVEGLRAFLTASSTYSHSGGPLTPFDIHYRSQIVRTGLDYAVIRSRDRTVSVQGGFEWVHQDSDALIDTIEIDEDLRVLFSKVRLIEPDLVGGLLDAELELRLGLDALGANQRGGPRPPGFEPADLSFFTAGIDLDYRRPLPAGFTLRARAQGQISTGDLPSFETFSLGNYTIGRGFSPGAVSGDNGIAGGLEIAWAIPLTEIPGVAAPELFGFVEGGRAWIDGASAGLTSLGGGVRFQLLERLDAEVTVAVPVQASDLVQDDGVRGLFRITAFF